MSSNLKALADGFAHDEIQKLRILHKWGESYVRASFRQNAGSAD